jgi:hypothetical protein
MPQENDDNLLEALNEHMRKEREQKQKEEYASWCETHATVPADYAPQLKPGLVAEIELAPMDVKKEPNHCPEGQTFIQRPDDSPEED